MIFGFQARGGTAPTLTTSDGYKRPSLGGGPVVDGFRRYYNHTEDEEGELGLPAAPAFRGQKLGKRGARGTTEKGHVHLQSRPRPGRGKRPNEGRGHNDGMGPMLASRPASRQVLSDLMELNLALKYDKARKHGEARPQKERSHHHNGSTTRKVGRRNDGGVAATSSSSPRRFSAPFDRREKQTSMSRQPAKSEHYQAEPGKAHPSSVVPNVVSNNQFEGDVGHNHDVMEQCDRWNGGLRSAPSKVSVAATIVTSSPGCFEVYPGKDSPVGRTSPATTLAGQLKANKAAARAAYACSGPSDWRNVYGSAQHDVGDKGFSGPGFGGEEDLGVSLGDKEWRGEQRARPPCHDSSSQQSEKDQRMWSALKTSLLSGSEAQTDPPYDNLPIGRTEDRGTPNDDGRYVGNGGVRENGEARDFGFLTEARDMEQLDQERSAMDRTMRPHRIASARLLETSRNSPSSPINVKHPRTFSASAARPRTYQSELSSSVWTGSTGTLECTGVRAELVPRNGDGQSGFGDESVNLADHHAFPGEAGSHQRDGGQQQARKVDSGRFQWVTNDEGVANFLQRPPSRQKEAFPTNLADTVPYPAFQVELPVADDEAKQNIDVIRKNAVEQARPSSRHKPPGQSLFLEVSETRRQVPPAFSPSQGTVTACSEPFSGLPAGILPMDGVDIEATPNCDALGTIFSLDRRHDNPDRDGFSVLQVQGPCPFRIEVTNSFVQPHPSMVSVALEATLAANRSGTGKTGKPCPPNPSCGFFGSMPCEIGGRPCTGRAPINTTPNLSVPATSSPIQVRCDATGKGTCGMSFRMLGGRSAGGAALRGATNLVPCTSRHEEGATVGDVPSPPSRPGNSSREPEREGKLCAPEGRAMGGPGEGMVEEGTGWKANDVVGGVTSTWRADTKGLRVNTGAPGVHVSDWSLQSCDDADDGAFLDGPVSTLGESIGAQHTLLETTLGQDFLSLFAPSSGHENSVDSGDK